MKFKLDENPSCSDVDNGRPAIRATAPEPVIPPAPVDPPRPVVPPVSPPEEAPPDPVVPFPEGDPQPIEAARSTTAPKRMVAD
jgi:hypothetical protein